MLRQICELGDFLRRMRTQLRFGDLSRGSLRLLRLEVQGDSAECDWMARPADPWDTAIAADLRDRRVAEQSLRDAIQVRNLLFSIFPDVVRVAVRVYRRTDDPWRELIIVGTVRREKQVETAVKSLVMRAKLLGLHFQLEEGKLEALDGEQPVWVHRPKAAGLFARGDA